MAGEVAGPVYPRLIIRFRVPTRPPREFLHVRQRLLSVGLAGLVVVDETQGEKLSHAFPIELVDELILEHPRVAQLVSPGAH